MKLWDKGYELNQAIETFTVQNDYRLDQRLIPYDCRLSRAHAIMLESIGVLNQEELKSLIDALQEILEFNQRGEFTIQPGDEDCHTAIENYLIEVCGEAGKKIHTGRSRNDQVLTALRLYEKDKLGTIGIEIKNFKQALHEVIKRYPDLALPGYTHMQRAMPSSVSMWLGALIEAMEDNERLLQGVLEVVDQSPLGTGAGFGVPGLQLDREQTAKELGFSRLTENPVYAQHSRGKVEAAMVHLCSQILYDINKLANDLLLFNTREFGLVSLPRDLCTGSSIMPQKQNADVLEIMRGMYHVVVGEEIKIQSIMGNLMSGYNRDLQLTKGPLFVSLDHTSDCLGIGCVVLSGISFDEKRCASLMTEELFAVEEVYRLVQSGIPFREAYRQVSRKFFK